MDDQDVPFGSRDCGCPESHPATRYVVLTGGPGAGKTAVLELVRRSLCRHLALLPEAAGIVFGGGFPRRADAKSRSASQRAIYHVQHELEELVRGDPRAGTALCDRGKLDGLAYWPGDEADFFEGMRTTREAELARYDAVIHLRPPDGAAYDRSNNRLRIEDAAQAHAVDLAIEHAWRGHPNRHFVPSADTFLTKAMAALQLIRAELPACCREHVNLEP
jgi:predicted ATPase